MVEKSCDGEKVMWWWKSHVMVEKSCDGGEVMWWWRHYWSHYQALACNI